MTLNQLQAFVLAATRGTFSAAAVELGVAQPSISELVRRLEEHLDTVLFVRGGRTLSLTAAGVELLPHAEKAIEAIELGAKAVSSIGSLVGGTATFGMLRNGSHYMLADLAQRFHTQHPDVRIRLVGLNSAETATAILNGTIEAGLLILPINDDQLHLTPLLADEVFYVSADPAATAEPVTVSALADRKLVLYDAHFAWRDPTRRQLFERAQLAGVELEPAIEVEWLNPALDLAARGVGDTIASRAVIEGPTFPSSLHYCSFSPPLYDVIALATKRGRPYSRATREMARLAKDTIAAFDRQREAPIDAADSTVEPITSA